MTTKRMLWMHGIYRTGTSLWIKLGHMLNAVGRFLPKLSISTVNTAGAVTYTATQLLGGFILRDPNGAARSDVLPTAALLKAAVQGCVVGTAIEFEIRNTADADELLTITAGTGVTLSPTSITIGQNNTRRLTAVFSNVGSTPAYTVYSGPTGTF